MSDNRPPGLTADKQALLALRKMRARIEELERARTEPIAIVGAGCRLPGGVDTPDAFWELLRRGQDAVADVPRERWDVDAFYDPDPDAPGKMYTRRGGFLANVDAFDPRHFGITPREAVSMDPQQRLLLEVTWEALERAGIAPDTLTASDTGVFVGISTNDYGQILLKASDQIDPGMYFGTGNLLNAASGRLSYVLGLQGPCMAIDTACSSSLVAIHLACQSLRSRECRMALAGGANLVLVPEVTVNCCRAKMLAPDGRCKTFDAAADGYVRGEGCGIIVLKRLSDATADGDRILALIRGSAVNQDGRSGGFTAPNELAQRAVIRAALASAGVAPADVSYVEAHGTGTSLGDPIEIHAIAAALSDGRSPDRPLTVGSVKTNVGHLEAAAGVTGLLKVVLALQHEQVPPHLHFRAMNPHIELDGFPLQVPSAAMPWPRGERPRLAGVSSFGFTGTNAHVILEEAPPPAPRADVQDRPIHLLAISARTENALRELSARYAAHLDTGTEPFGDVCQTAAVARAQFDHRLAVVAATASGARDALAAVAADVPSPRARAGKVRSRDEGVVFLFTGQGAQYPGMGRELYESQPVFKRAIDQCDEILRGTLERPLLSVLYPAPGEVSPMDDTAYTQPALFAVEFALATLWQSWGIGPSAVLGHSVGEYVAACIAGVMPLDAGLRLIAARARLMQQLPAGGTMAAVLGDEAQVRAAVEGSAGRVSIAALNGPGNTVIAGAAEDVARVIAALGEAGTSAKMLTVSHAFHSRLMDPMLAEFERLAHAVEYAAPKIPFVSNLTGSFVPPGFAFDGSYWRRHAREAVRFAEGITAVRARGERLFLEIGPAPTLSAMGRRVVGDDEAKWLPSLRKGRGDWQQMLESAADLYVNGVAMDWSAFDAPYARRKADLPTYPFQRERYWVKVAAPQPATTVSARVEPSAVHTYSVEWIAKDAAARATTETAPGGYVVAAESNPFVAAVRSEFERFGETCSVVAPRENAAEFVEAILAAAGSARGLVLIAPAAGSGAADDRLRAERLCDLLASLARALDSRPAPAPRIFVVTAGVQPVAGSAPSTLGDSTLWGLGRVLALEHPAIWGGLVDVSADATLEDAVRLVHHLREPDGEDQAAFRGGTRYVPRLTAPVAPSRARMQAPAEGTVVITGGLGSLGLALADRFVARGARSLALVGRRGLPSRDQWAGIAPETPAGKQIAAVRQLEQAGATVHVCSADIANAADVDRLFATLARSAAPVRGVVHAAGVSRPELIAELRSASLTETFSPKVTGGWLLHEATRSLPLDFFVLFSSISSVWGSRSLGSYAAANHYLDALAHHRRALGLPATSINWGPWADGGMMDTAGEQWLAALGIAALKPADALDVFEDVVASGAAQAVVAAIDWATFLPVYEARGSRPFMERMRAAIVTAPTAAADRGFVERLAALLPAERRALIAKTVSDHVGRVIGTDSTVVGADDGLFDLGMDSLMATELRRILARQFDCALPPTLTFDYPNVGALTEFLDQELFGAAPAPTAAPAAAAVDAASDLAAAIAALETVSDDEAEMLLRGATNGR